MMIVPKPPLGNDREREQHMQNLALHPIHTTSIFLRQHENK